MGSATGARSGVSRLQLTIRTIIESRDAKPIVAAVMRELRISWISEIEARRAARAIAGAIKALSTEDPLSLCLVTESKTRRLWPK
jgi:hypothetical protein